MTVVLPTGEVVELGGKALDPEGPDLLGVLVGSEGTLGIVTEITLRVVRAPEVGDDAAGRISLARRGGCGRLRDRGRTASCQPRSR